MQSLDDVKVVAEHKALAGDNMAGLKGAA